MKENFEDWCKNNNKEYLLNEWDYDKNNLKPDKIAKSSNKKIYWICSKSHSFETKISNRTILNRGCPYCSNNKVLKGFNDFEIWCKNNNKEYLLNEWDYDKNNFKPSEITYGSGKNIYWKCNFNHAFKIKLYNRTIDKTNCPKCNESKGEKIISNYLDKININHKNQYKIVNCKNINSLPFDFAIFNNKNNLLRVIEFDGKQHFEIVDYWGGIKSLKEVHFRDNIKTTYCEENNIPLLSIKYNQIDIIEEILDDFLKDPSRYVTNHFYNMTKEEYYSELYENLENEGEY